MGFSKRTYPCDPYLSQEHLQCSQKVPLLPFPLNPPNKAVSTGTQTDEVQGNSFLIQEA